MFFKKIIVFIYIFGFLFSALSTSLFAEPVSFSFEGDKEGWDIPDWTFEKNDYVGRFTELSSDVASQGKESLAVMCDFPGDLWTAAIIERESDMDLSAYDTISVDVFLPKEASSDLFGAKIIITTGAWYFLEMRNSAKLEHGGWTTITANLKNDDEWRYRLEEQKLSLNISNVKKIAVRIEYNANPRQAGPKYNGPIYIDNFQIK